MRQLGALDIESRQPRAERMSVPGSLREQLKNASSWRELKRLYADISFDTETRGESGGRRGALAEAIRYALARWEALCRFRHDGRIEFDNNPVERAIRPIALGRKNHLFAGSDGGGVRWASVCSLIATAKLNNVEPFGYLKDVLERMSTATR
jgi:hypothetical protein